MIFSSSFMTRIRYSFLHSQEYMAVTSENYLRLAWEKGKTILNNDNKLNQTHETIKFKINLFLRYGRRSPSMATIFTMSFSGLTIWIMI